MKSFKVFLVLLLLAAGGAACYFFLRLRERPEAYEAAYVMPSSVAVFDSRAEIHNVMANPKQGDRVEVLSHSGNWAELRLPDGRKGWVEAKDLMDSRVYEGGLELLKDLQGIPVQAVGHTAFEVNLHLSPSREGPLLDHLQRNQSLEVFGRRLVPRVKGGGEGPEKTNASPASPDLEAWYLVRVDSRAGWVLGRLVNLDIPEDISAYAQNYNTVAWLVLNTVEDNGRKVPQYVVADREDTEDVDFTHIRVFTWWAKQGHYATSFVESHLKGFFPIQVTHTGNEPEFRLRLMDARGRKYQKIYRLEDTVVRQLGTVEGWTSNAMPPIRQKIRSRRRR